MAPHPPYALTIRDAAQLIAHRDLSPVELTRSVLERIAATEPKVHAYALVTERLALAQAREAEGEILAGRRRGPLHGIPINLKDLYFTAGTPTAGGSRVLAGHIPSEDAEVTTRLRNAGAVLVGKTVTHEFAYGQNVPPTRNPWNLACYPGGSSAGAGVSVAVDSTLGAMGTDTGGSIRVPGAVNGIVALKPTFGRVSKRGVIPMSATLDTAGPLTKTVYDNALMLGAVAGYDPRDPTSIDVPVPDFTAGLATDLTGVRLGLDREYFLYPTVRPAVRQAFDQALRVLRSLGAEIVEVRIPYLEHAAAAGLVFVMADTSAYHQRWLRERGDQYEPGTRLMLQAGELILATDYVQAMRLRHLLKRAVRDTFQAHRLTALVAPTMPTTTVPVEQLSVSLVAETGETALAAALHHGIPFNLTGLPAVSIPCGFSEERLTIGLQIIARPFDEATVYRIGHAYESATSWHLESPPM